MAKPVSKPLLTTTIYVILLVIIAMALNINPSFCPIRTRQLIIIDFYNNYPIDYIAGRYQLSPETVLKYIKRYKLYETVLSEYELNKKYDKITRRKILDDPRLSSYLDRNCIFRRTTSLDEYSCNLMGDFGIQASPVTIGRYFNNKGWKWKKISRIAMEVDLEEEYLFWQYVEDILYDPRCAMFLDENNRNDKTANKTYARGQGRVYVPVRFHRGTYRFSMICVSWIDGIIDYEIYYGAVNTDKFMHFITERFWEHFQPYPEHKSVLFLDNIRFHHYHIFLQLMLLIGVIIIFLPHYDPILNLTEYVFRDIQAIEMSKNQYGEIESYMSLIDTVESLKNKPYGKILKQIGYID